MPFCSPTWVPPVPDDPNVSLEDFLLDESYGRQPFEASRKPLICSTTGKCYDIASIRQRVDHIARALANRLDFAANHGSEWDKVVAIYSVNCIDYFPAAWSVLSLGGVVTTASAAFTASELERQLKHSGAKALFTCHALLLAAQTACQRAGISPERIFILDVPGQQPSQELYFGHETLGELVDAGSKLPPIDPHVWPAGESARRTAFLLYSSGTSGLPKGVMLTHRNFITSILQSSAFKSKGRRQSAEERAVSTYTENSLGLLPFAHIFAIAMIVNLAVYRGDSVIILPTYHLETMLANIADYQINILYLTPPMIADILRSIAMFKQYDLSSVNSVHCGGSPLRVDVFQQLQTMFPDWKVHQGYGSTEGTGAISLTSSHDVQYGTCGSLLPGNRVRLVTADGKDVSEYEQRGELFLSGPAVFKGYLDNGDTDAETFVQFDDGRYARTGDWAIFRLGDAGYEHVVIIDRVKE